MRNADRDNTVRQRWPQKAAALQSLREQARALAIMPNDLDQITAAAPKNIKVASMRITLQALLNQPCQAREATSHIGVTGRKPHPYIPGIAIMGAQAPPGPAPAPPGRRAHPLGCVAGCQDRSRSIQYARLPQIALGYHPQAKASKFSQSLPRRRSAPAQNAVQRERHERITVLGLDLRGMLWIGRSR